MIDDNEVANENPPIPHETHVKRINVKNKRIEALEKQLLKAEESNTQLSARAANAGDSEKLERRLAKATAAQEVAESALATHVEESTTREAMLTHGITDPDDMDLVRYRYDRLDAAGRPALDKWLGEGGGGREDRHIKGLFEASNDAENSEEARQEQPARRGLPRVHKDAKAPARPAGSLTRESILAMPIAERLKPENREKIMEALKA